MYPSRRQAVTLLSVFLLLASAWARADAFRVTAQGHIESVQGASGGFHVGDLFSVSFVYDTDATGTPIPFSPLRTRYLFANAMIGTIASQSFADGPITLDATRDEFGGPAAYDFSAPTEGGGVIFDVSQRVGSPLNTLLIPLVPTDWQYFYFQYDVPFGHLNSDHLQVSVDRLQPASTVPEGSSLLLWSVCVVPLAIRLLWCDSRRHASATGGSAPQCRRGTGERRYGSSPCSPRRTGDHARTASSDGSPPG